MHFLSAGLVSFARGLNDTPKIAALLLAAPAFTSFSAATVCGVAMALGGWLGAKRTAETMSHRITSMNAGQGFTANLATAVLVTSASRWGLPVSTTHVSCGALFGIGSTKGHGNYHMIGQILLAWITTLPCAAAIAWLILAILA
jgi:PiT family inorganic phosphate transporter